ncbi:hypothetical protein LDL36_06930 [Komagataeibacter sp. FNDCR1]|nr:hypothetical protein [Komagataeibacter sp. FNDCR1]
MFTVYISFLRGILFFIVSAKQPRKKVASAIFNNAGQKIDWPLSLPELVSRAPLGRQSMVLILAGKKTWRM